MKRKQPQPSDPIDLAARALRHHDPSRRRTGLGDKEVVEKTLSEIVA